MSILATVGVLAPVVQEIIDLFKKKDDNKISQKEAELELERIINTRMEILTQLLRGQLDINKTEAEAGRLGWRNWLGKGLSIAAIYGLLVEPIIRSMLALGTLLGLDAQMVQQVNTLMPQFNWEIIMPLLGGLLGLYGLRGIERVKHAQTAADFNKSVFYDMLRKGYGGKITQPHFKMIEDAFKKAGLK